MLPLCLLIQNQVGVIENLNMNGKRRHKFIYFSLFSNSSSLISATIATIDKVQS